MVSNEELMKTMKLLVDSVKFIQDKLATLKRRAIHNSANPQSSSGTQQSGTDVVASDKPPPRKKTRVDEGDTTNDEREDCDDLQAPLVPFLEAASAFLAAAFTAKLENRVRVAKAKGQSTPVSQWIQCAKIDPVLTANVPPAARTADRAASRVQQFWLDATNPLVILLEKAVDLNLPKEVISGIQTALQLMGNANHHHSTATDRP